MRWITTDMDQYLQAKEYIDCAIVPIVPVEFASSSKTVASGEYVQALAYEMERQYKGRVLLLPAYTYLKSADLVTKKAELLDWKHYLIEQGLTHVFMLTTEAEWRQFDGELEGSLLWVPSLPFHAMKDEDKRDILQQQAESVSSIFTASW
ncbi:YpiF family protein [Priestia koreensis]|uniref:YpiF family protein n=1 Tax=Priestia koreensis TaxID=284581 RepID=UPI003D02AA7B